MTKSEAQNQFLRVRAIIFGFAIMLWLVDAVYFSFFKWDLVSLIASIVMIGLNILLVVDSLKNSREVLDHNGEEKQLRILGQQDEDLSLVVVVHSEENGKLQCSILSAHRSYNSAAKAFRIWADRAERLGYRVVY